jgi:hypothetical protein
LYSRGPPSLEPTAQIGSPMYHEISAFFAKTVRGQGSPRRCVFEGVLSASPSHHPTCRAISHAVGTMVWRSCVCAGLFSGRHLYLGGPWEDPGLGVSGASDRVEVAMALPVRSQGVRHLGICGPILSYADLRQTRLGSCSLTVTPAHEHARWHSRAITPARASPPQR